MSKIVFTLVVPHSGGRPQLVVSSANSTNVTLSPSLQPGLANGNLDGHFGRLRKRFEFAVAGGGGTGTMMNTTKLLPNTTWMTGLKLPSIPAVRSKGSDSESRRSESARPSRGREERPRLGRRPSSVDRIEGRTQDERKDRHRRSGSRNRYHDKKERQNTGESEKLEEMYRLDSKKRDEGRKRVEWRYGVDADEEDWYTDDGTVGFSSSSSSEGRRSTKRLEELRLAGRVEGRHRTEYENDHDRRRQEGRARFDDKYIDERAYRRDHGRESRRRIDRKSDGHYAGAHVAGHRKYDGVYASGIDGGDGGFAGAN